jgi:phage-related protein
MRRLSDWLSSAWNTAKNLAGKVGNVIRKAASMVGSIIGKAAPIVRNIANFLSYLPGNDVQ